MPAQPLVSNIVASCLAVALLLGGIHSKDLVAPLVQGPGVKQADDFHAKVAAELHHHSDSSIKIQQSADGHQADSRSLRLLNRNKLQGANRLERLWRWWLEGSLNLT